MKDQTVIIQFGPDGNGRCLYTDAIDLTTLGTLAVKRASTIEYNAERQEWEVKLINQDSALPFEWTGTPYRNASRAACIAWEHEHFARQLQTEDGKL